MLANRLSTRAVKVDGTLISFVGVHLAALGVFWTGMGWKEFGLAVCLYFLRMFAITGGYHRLFAHRAYQTSRAFQFVMAFMAQTSLQSGAVWWAAKHRDHHHHSDTPRDVHSPRQYGFWFAHMGWIFHSTGGKADYSKVPDLTRRPELMFLDRQRFAPGILLGFLCWAFDSWSGVTAFLVSTVVLYHCTFFINSLAHVHGTQRYLTGDDARNNWWLALLTLGEGWHNNHHYFMASSRQGFYWWEVDFTYYLLRGLKAVGLVWDLKEPPAHVLAGQRSLSEELKDRIAEHLASSFVRSLPQLPSMDEMRRRAQKMFARSPAMDEIIARAREMLELAMNGQLILTPVRA